MKQIHAQKASETIQTIILLTGAFAITWYGWHHTSGWSGMTASLDASTAAVQGHTDGKLMSMLRPHGDADGMPWYAVFLGYPVLGIWYWCADQTIVQRVLGARSENDARVGSIFCGLIKILPVFIFIVPGLMFYTAIKQGNIEGVAQVRVAQVRAAQVRAAQVRAAIVSSPNRKTELQRIRLAGDFRVQFALKLNCASEPVFNLEFHAAALNRPVILVATRSRTTQPARHRRRPGQGH